MHFALHFYMQKNALFLTLLYTTIQTLYVTSLFPKNKRSAIYLMKKSLYFDLSMLILRWISTMIYPSMSLLGFLHITATTSSISWQSGLSWFVPHSSPDLPSLYFLSVSTSDNKYDTGLYSHMLSSDAAWKEHLMIITILFLIGLFTNYPYMVENLLSDPYKWLWRAMVYDIFPILAIDTSTFLLDLPRPFKKSRTVYNIIMEYSYKLLCMFHFF